MNQLKTLVHCASISLGLAVGVSSLTCAPDARAQSNGSPPKAAAASSPGAAPFGLAVGSASCDAVRTRFGRSDEKDLGGGDLWLEARGPEQLYPGATKVAARCSEGKVIAIVVEASKGGMGADAAREVYATLSSKYRLVAGGPMPALGDGYARFVAGNTVVEQTSPHLSFEFKVTYLSKAFYDELQADGKRERDQAQQKKRSTL